MANYQSLSRKHPRFIYKSCRIDKLPRELRFSFRFEMEPDIVFTPTVAFALSESRPIQKLREAELNTIAFHLGLAEIPSYWKATCSPEIIVEAGYLNAAQIKFWKKLLLKGLGEFFYKNKIDFTKKRFVSISSPKNAPRHAPLTTSSAARGKILIPIGGGKDSAVTLELLKQHGFSCSSFMLGARPAQMRVAHIGGGSAHPIRAERKIDPALLTLNDKGCLNGHTPFSAYLAFLSVSAAALFGYEYVAVSNERSANEGNLRYRGTTINHQYSKTFEFEKDFAAYNQTFFAPKISYFSFLRPLHEIQIARLFASYPQYFPAFRSCNVGSKGDRWCNNCPKCLFAFLILYPFLSEKDILGIFGKNLLADVSLSPILKELLGASRHKPFECVGTHAEVAAALHLAIKKSKTPLPILLQKIQPYLPRMSDSAINKLLASFDTHHQIPPQFVKLLI